MEKKLLSGVGEAKHNGEPQAFKTLSAAATPSAPASNSPPGITFTRSAAPGLPSPILAGIFRDDSGRSLRHADGYTPLDGDPAASSSGTVGVAPSGSDAKAEQRSDGGGNKKTGGAAVVGGAVSGGSAGVAGAAAIERDPPQAPRGSKFGVGDKARSIPVCGSQGSPEGG